MFRGFFILQWLSSHLLHPSTTLSWSNLDLWSVICAHLNCTWNFIDSSLGQFRRGGTQSLASEVKLSASSICDSGGWTIKHPVSLCPSRKLILLISHWEIKCRSAPIPGPFGWDTNSFGNTLIYARTSFQKIYQPAKGCLGTTKPLHKKNGSSAHKQSFSGIFAFLLTPTSHKHRGTNVLVAEEASYNLHPPWKEPAHTFWGVLAGCLWGLGPAYGCGEVMLHPQHSPSHAPQCQFISCLECSCYLRQLLWDPLF